jgi:hypothetical protein
MNKLINGTLIALFVSGCGLTNPGSPESDAYLSVRIVNNELGRLLKQYHSSVHELAQKQLDIESTKECQANDNSCKTGVKNRIAQRFSEREVRYNQVADIQRETKRLLEFADNVCATLTEQLCEESKHDVIGNKKQVEKAWNELSGWVQ